jgi:pyruvate ferredoxin oxidoreductase gamma subunit
MLEIRFHGRGGQGAVTSAEMVALAAIDEGKYAQAFPSFGPERRGAPVQAFNRIETERPIRVRGEILEPNVIVVLDPSLMDVVDVKAGLKPGGIAVVNSRKTPSEIRAKLKLNPDQKVVTVDASKIAKEILGVPITNTTMLGALVKATQVVKIDSLLKPLEHRFGLLTEKNVKAMRAAYDHTRTEE